MAATPSKFEELSKLRVSIEPEILKRISDAVAEKDEEIKELKATIDTFIKVDIEKVVTLCESLQKEATDFEYYSVSYVVSLIDKIRNSVEGS